MIIPAYFEPPVRSYILKAVEDVNECQKTVLFNKLAKHFGGETNLKGKALAVCDLAFKSETDDMREATVLVLIDLLVKVGGVVRVYDPVAMNECKRRMAARRCGKNSQASPRMNAVPHAELRRDEKVYEERPHHRWSQYLRRQGICRS